MSDGVALPGTAFRFDRGDGIALHGIEAGAGDPIVLVHGNPTWAWYWRAAVEPLSRHGRVIVPDHVGMGRSDRPSEDRYRYTLDSRVADLDALLRARGADRRVTLVVHDWGGMIGLAWAARNPDAVARLVVTNTAGFPLMAGKSFPKELHLVRNTPAGPLLVRGLDLFVKGTLSRGATTPLDAEAVRGYREPYRSWKRRLAVLRFVQDIPLRPGDPAWDTVAATADALEGLRSKPRLVLWGLRDFIFDGDFLAEWERRWPDAEFERWEDAGHLLMEDAGPAVVARIERFLDEHPLPAEGPAA